MIDPRELRQGNILNVLSGERVLIPTYQVKIAEIGFLGCEVYRIEDHPAKTNWILYDHQHLDPIPLTPEWLERFGFEKNDYNVDGVQYSEPYFHIELESRGWLVRWIDTLSTWAIHPKVSDYNSVPIKYVHQLQNLYFALTRNELTLKDKP